jgi:Rrf2 family protein
MKLNTRMRYGTRAMVHLARHSGEGYVSLAQVADAEDLPVKYLEALLASLRTAGLVATQRGPQGGYALARPAAEITLLDIFRVLESSEPYAPCDSGPDGCRRRAECATQRVWARMVEAAMGVLEATTLAELVPEADCPVQPEYAI